MVDNRKLMKLVAVKNTQYGHATPDQTLFLQTLKGQRQELSRKLRRVARAKALEAMYSSKSEFEVPELSELITGKAA